VEASSSDRPQAVAADLVARRHEHANAVAEEIFEVLASVHDAPRQVISTLELIMTIGLVVIVTMEHDLIALIGDAASQVLNQGPILMEGMNRPSSTVPLWNPLACPGAMEWNDRQRNRTTAIHISVRVLELLRRRKKTRVVVADAELHLGPPFARELRPQARRDIH
jgi:hypothetical protein